MKHPLPPVPPSITDAAGTPRFGTFEGALETVELSDLNERFRPPWMLRPLRHKRWFYAFAATDQVAVIQSVADLTYTANAFLVVVDLKRQRVLVDQSWLGLSQPFTLVSNRPQAGLKVRFRHVRTDLRAECHAVDDRYRLISQVNSSLPFAPAKAQLDASLLASHAAPALTVIAPVDEGGTVNVTQKWAGLLSFGSLNVQGQPFNLDGGVGGIDYTHGYLARRTAWRWAFMCGRTTQGDTIGVNLVEGFNDLHPDVNENALWFNGQLIGLDRARFHWNRHDVLDRWKVETTDGRVKLEFRPIAAHREERDLKVAHSHFVQPIGLFSGSIEVDGKTLSLQDVPGVTEDQDVLW